MVKQDINLTIQEQWANWYAETLTTLAASSPKAVNGRGDNREYEVGRRGGSWERIDDRIEEETTSYKFKM